MVSKKVLLFFNPVAKNHKQNSKWNGPLAKMKIKYTFLNAWLQFITKKYSSFDSYFMDWLNL